MPAKPLSLGRSYRERLQARYGFGKGEAEREIEAWVKTQRFAA